MQNRRWSHTTATSIDLYLECRILQNVSPVIGGDTWVATTDRVCVCWYITLVVSMFPGVCQAREKYPGFDSDRAEPSECSGKVE